MQDLVEGCVYEGVLQIGPFSGTRVLLKFTGTESPYGDDVKVFRVEGDVEFGEDEDDPEDDGWWRVGQIVHLTHGSYKFTPYNPCLENK